MRIGVDVGGTFTDLVAWDGRDLKVVKVPSSPPGFERAVIEATNRASGPNSIPLHIVHGSTVATNALLQRAGARVAFITTEGFRDMLLIGRQNRPSLYSLRVERPMPITPSECWFTVRERVDASGKVLIPLDDAQVNEVIQRIGRLGISDVAVCLLFSFVNPGHERRIGGLCEAAGLRVSLSSDLMPEFREYERASTTAINASLRPTVESYLESLERGLPESVRELRIMQSGGGTLGAGESARQACKLVLSGPAGGVIGAAFVARRAGNADVITYDMGGTSTDVALILDGRPQWTTATQVDGLPIGLPMFDIQTVGAGGGSIARRDAGGALRVGPASAGAVPGPACYGRGGQEATVTDANLVLGRILPDQFLGGAMPLHAELAHAAMARVAGEIGKTPIEAAVGIIRVVESNMARAIHAVSSRRGHDPRRFSLVSFGGAGGLHACALAESLEMSRVLVPPYCGVLSALGMIVAPPVSDASRTVIHLGPQLDDDRLAAEYGSLSSATMEQVSYEQTESVEVFADVRFVGQSHELTVRTDRPSRQTIEQSFLEAYARIYGRIPGHRPIEIVTLRVRRVGRATNVELPPIERAGPAFRRSIELILGDGGRTAAPAVSRGALASRTQGPLLVIDPEATTFVPPGWSAVADDRGMLVLEKH